MNSLDSCIKSGQRVHLVGIGGVSMSPLAELLHSLGLQVTGSDVLEGPLVANLKAKGIPVTIGHHPDNIKNAQFIIRTAAAREDNPEITAARNTNIPIFERAQAWGYIMQGYKNAICISGTHGKTTTTSMMTHILKAAKLDPTVMIGGTLPALGSGYCVGKGDTILLEACEYYNSFHNFFPTIAVILNIDADHLDFFGSIDEVRASFRKFAALVPETGVVIQNADDKNTEIALKNINRNTITFAIENMADVQAKNINLTPPNTNFDLYHNQNFISSITLKIPGKHNVTNALAACATALSLNINPKAIVKGLADFQGVKRRFEYKGQVNGAPIYDDYAHHPSEIKALLDSASLKEKQIILTFQPHTYSRTKALFNEFVNELKKANKLYLADIYAAREHNEQGISSQDIANAIPGAVYCSSFQEIADNIKTQATPNDIVLTAGAGDIYKVGEILTQQP